MTQYVDFTLTYDPQPNRDNERIAGLRSKERIAYEEPPVLTCYNRPSLLNKPPSWKIPLQTPRSLRRMSSYLLRKNRSLPTLWGK